MYLEPIFASDDIKKKMPTEKSKFDTIDSNWRAIMTKFSVEKNLWEGIENDRMKQDLSKDHRNLEQIQQ